MDYQNKLALHMADEERYLLLQHVKSITDWNKTRYLFQRMEQRSISYEQIDEALADPKLIEFRWQYPSKRILIQSRHAYDGRVVCVALDLHTKTILTTYWHRLQFTSRWRSSILYNENLDICRTYEHTLS